MFPGPVADVARRFVADAIVVVPPEFNRPGRSVCCESLQVWEAREVDVDAARRIVKRRAPRRLDCVAVARLPAVVNPRVIEAKLDQGHASGRCVGTAAADRPLRQQGIDLATDERIRDLALEIVPATPATRRRVRETVVQRLRRAPSQQQRQQRQQQHAAFRPVHSGQAHRRWLSRGQLAAAAKLVRWH